MPQRGEPDANGRFLADPITHWRGREGRVWVELSRSTDLIRTPFQRSGVQYTFDARHHVAAEPDRAVLELDRDQAVAAEAPPLTRNILEKRLAQAEWRGEINRAG